MIDKYSKGMRVGQETARECKLQDPDVVNMGHHTTLVLAQAHLAIVNNDTPNDERCSSFDLGFVEGFMDEMTSPL
jgi:hypothetical protein